MSTEPLHSPAPFALQLPLNGIGGYLIRDALGDSLAALAFQTGDHPPEEQLANALLLTAAPQLLVAARLGREALAEDRRLTIEAHTVPDPVTLEPDLATLEEIAESHLAELDRRLALVDAAIAATEIQP
jgi:hypothetical protein